MLNTYSDYINRFLSKEGLKDRPCPGEHHFVSVYLVPRLFAINQRVPDYINPDGTKGIIGDVVYFRDQEHQFGIEVKLGTIRLTKGEFNEWVVNRDPARWPHTFIAIGSKGIALCAWKDFRRVYISSIREKDPSWEPALLSKGYGPTKSVNVLLSKLPQDKCHMIGKTDSEAEQLEMLFMNALRSEVDC